VSNVENLAVSRSPRPRVHRLDRARHVAPQVLERLRERIVSLELPPGSLLSRGDVAA